MAHFAYDYNPTKTQSYLDNKITDDKFHSWGKDNMYRTSYASMYTDKPHEPKNYVLPGYAGFVPGFKSRGEFGKTFAKIAKESLNHNELGVNKFHLSSTGFNVGRHPPHDHTLTASSHKFGCQTSQKPHPSLWGGAPISHTHDTYKNPEHLPSPTHRPVSVDLVNTRGITQTSGYGTNCITFDGKGFLPNETTADPRRTTEYRVRYNSEKPYHLNTTSFHVRKLKTMTTKNPLNIEKQR